MHPNPAFRRPGDDRNIAFARERGFGVLTIAGPDGPLASHIPFVLDKTGGTLAAHVVRSNPIWRLLKDGEAQALIVVSGPDGYVSPDWYETDDQVPTWNYVAVHLRGALRLLPPERLRDHLVDISAEFEPRLLGKRPWTLDKMSEEPLARMMRTIAPVEMSITSIDGTWKLNQNKPDDVRARAAKAIRGSDIGVELDALAALMQDPPP